MIGKAVPKYSIFIKFCRCLKGYSREKLASAVGITRVSISNYEKGEHEPSLITFEKILIELGFNITDYYHFDAKRMTELFNKDE